MAEKFEVKNLYLNFGPTRFHSEMDEEDLQPEESVSEDQGDAMTDLLASLLGLDDDEEECYTEEEIQELSAEVADRFELSMKRAREIVDFVFDWAEKEDEED